MGQMSVIRISQQCMGRSFSCQNLTGEGVVYQIGNHVWEIASPST